MARSKDPYFNFFPCDWMGDTELRLLPLEARGLWLDMLCIMHQSSSGFLLEANGKKIGEKELALLAHIGVEKCSILLKQIVEAGVCSVDKDGFIFSRRLKRDSHIRSVRSKAGKAGYKEKKKRILLKQNVQANSGNGNGNGNGNNRTSKTTTNTGIEKEEKKSEEKEIPMEKIYSEDVFKIYERLCKAFKARDEKTKAIPQTDPQKRKALDQIRLLIEKDERPSDEVMRVIEHMEQDYGNGNFPGWGAVVRSFPKFRVQYEKMMCSAMSKKPKSGMSQDEYEKIKDDIVF